MAARRGPPAAVGRATSKVRSETAEQASSKARSAKTGQASSKVGTGGPAPTRKPTPAASSTAVSPFKSIAAVEPVYRALREAHPDAHCELNHRSAFELIIATVLSAQTTDVAVNKATPKLFSRYPTPHDLAAALPEEVEPFISSIGMFRQKAKNVVGLARALLTRHGGQVPATVAELIELPGVGRKTANVVMGVAFHRPEGVVVDTHVQRISQRLGWSREATPEKIERDLMRLLPQKEWDHVSHTLIFHGRRICTARRPSCATCPVNQLCPSAFRAENVGRKPSKATARS